MLKYKLFNTDGKTFFDFRTDPKSRCEAFTLSFLDDGTVVMSGDYGTLCWKREYGKRKDYGFPDKKTNINYFEEKVCQFGVEQKIKEWNKQKAIRDLKDVAKDNEFDEDKDYLEALESIECVEEYEDQEFYKIINALERDLWENELGMKYTEQFKFMFAILKSVSDQVLKAVNKFAKQDRSEK